MEVWLVLKIYLVSSLEYIINSSLFSFLVKYFLTPLSSVEFFPAFFFPYFFLKSTSFFLNILLRRSLSDMKIAFIADGNRRYHKKISNDTTANTTSLFQSFLSPSSFSHNLTSPSSTSSFTTTTVKKNSNLENIGIKKMKETIEFCYKYGIKEVSFYCFSVKNFSRQQEDIDKVMNLILNTNTSGSPFRFLINPRIKVYGNMNLLKREVKNILKDLEYRSRNNKDILVNLFIAYPSEEAEEYKGEVDLVIRTSGEKRLSGFLVRQCCDGSRIFFLKALWPEITVYHIGMILLKHKLENILFNN